MIKLTEEMIIARTRISDLSSVKKLNCWGADLQDVTLLRKMPNIEVLALSVNQIKTLADFQYCNRLQELYIRKNDIRDLRDICYLKGLANLKNLWLADNPCAEVEGYRMTVLRALPQLEKLDDIAVKPEDIQEAARLGRELFLPNKGEEDIPESHDYFQNNDSLSSSVNEKSSSRRASEVVAPTNAFKSAPLVSSPDLIEANQPQSIPEDAVVTQSINDDSIKRRFSSVTTGSLPMQERQIHSESAPTSRRSSLATSTFSPIVEHATSAMPSSLSTEQIPPSRCPVHHAPGSVGQQGYRATSSPVDSIPNHSPPPAVPAAPMINPAVYSTPTVHPSTEHYNNTPTITEHRNHYTEQQRSYRAVQDFIPPRHSPSSYLPLGLPPHSVSPQGAPTSSTPGSERSSPTRSSGRHRHRGSNFSNLLMATLCLVNELDYGSLEVLAMAVRNRLEEFDD